jgi:hypothetical protein
LMRPSFGVELVERVQIRRVKCNEVRCKRFFLLPIIDECCVVVRRDRCECGILYMGCHKVNEWIRN